MKRIMTRKALGWLTAGSAVALLTVPVLAQQSMPPANSQDRQLREEVTPSDKAATPQSGAEQPGMNQPPTAGDNTEKTQSRGVTFKTSQETNELVGIQGMPVQNANGDPLGEIKDVAIDKSGKVSTVIVAVGGFFGIGGKQVGVPYDGLLFSQMQNGQHVAFMNTNKEALQKAPAYKTQQSAGEGKSIPGKSSELMKNPATGNSQ